MKKNLVAAFVGSLAMGIAFAATAGPRDPDACPLACMDSYFSCVINGVASEHLCYQHYVRCVSFCPAF
jgi:hypothetical protein